MYFFAKNVILWYNIQIRQQMEATMALKDTLLAASIGATMVAGTHADTPQSVASSTKPAQTRSMSKAELQEINFKKNYQYLYKNVDGAWFSFGDEEKMRQALYDIGSFSMGREVIAGLPENMEFGSTHFIQFSLYGGFDVIDDSLKMSTRALGKTTNMDTNGTFVSVKDVLFHELMHAYQKKQGIILVDQHPSVDEAMHSFKLSEAETAAWNKVLSMTTCVSSSSSYFLTPKEVRSLMREDLVSKERQSYKEAGLKFSAENEKYFKETDSKYLMQQALIACHGNYDLAQKKLVGEEIKKLMNDSYSLWSTTYDKQTLNVTEGLCKEGMLSEQGNSVAYQKMLNHYKKNYGLNPQDIANVRLQTKYEDQIAQIKISVGQKNQNSNYANPYPSQLSQRYNNSR